MYFTGSAGGDYDVAPYDSTPAEHSGLAQITAFARHLNFDGHINDVADLGCGFGRQLASVAPLTTGRLVGVDASAMNCAGARKMLEPWKSRANIIQMDFAALDASAVGHFDLIYCIGTLYTVPAATREALLETIRTTLRPGGLVLFSYYAGTRGLIHSAISNYLRSLQQPNTSLHDAVVAVRDHLARVTAFSTPAPIDAVQKLLAQIANFDDVVIAHEVLGHGVALQNTAQISNELASADVEFLGYIGYNPASFDVKPEERVYVAETLDVLEGGYRHALFARRPS